MKALKYLFIYYKRILEFCWDKKVFSLFSPSEKICEHCHEQCDGCKGPTAFDCLSCKHVSDDYQCVKVCPSGKFANETGFCIPCNAYCLDGK